MDRHQYLVKEYQLILTLSEHMLTLAKEEKWDGLVELEVSYLKAVEATTMLPLSEEVTITVQNLIHLHLQRILDNESQIKTLLQARMNKLAELIGQSVKQQEVNTTYGRFTNRAMLCATSNNYVKIFTTPVYYFLYIKDFRDRE